MLLNPVYYLAEGVRRLFKSGLLLLVGAGCFSASCYRPLSAEMKIQSLKAVNLEETLSRRDELMMTWSLTAFDSQNRLVGVINNAWGVETVKKGAVVSLANQAPISLPIPKNGKVVASLVLLEVDDYSQAEQLIKRVKNVNQWVQVPVGLFVLSAEVLTPLKYVTLGLAAAGLSVELADRLDANDVLGQSSVELRDTDIRKSKQTAMHVPAHFTGQHLRDSFDYQVEYDIRTKQVRVKPTGKNKS